MFETIARGRRDDEATVRSLASLGIVGLLASSCWCTLLGYGLWVGGAAVPVAVPDIVDDGPLVQLVEDPEDLALAAPIGAPPPPPPAPQAASVDDGSTEPEPPEPEDEAIPQELPDPLPDAPVESAVRPEGQEDGVAGGDPDDGASGGMFTGKPGGTGTALAQARRPARLPPNQVRVRSRIQPRYPDQAKAMNLGDVVCAAKLVVDARGKPTDVQVSGCPKVFHPTAREALFGWRFYPARVNGEKVPATFTLRIRYRLRG